MLGFSQRFRYNLGMSEGKSLLLAFFVAGMAVPGIPAAWHFGVEKPFLAICGSIAGVISILLVVRLVNRRDSRRGTRPPDDLWH